jgi:hypothetical protein
MLCRNKNCKRGNFGKRAKFEPIRGEQVCSVECSIEVIQSKTYKRKREKEIRIANAINKKKVLNDLKTHSDWLKDLQKVFNKYIRLRDHNMPCVSCGRKLGEKYDAGHYFSVGAYPNLRFNETNVHASCVYCNQHKHGNIAEYSIRLPERIGEDAYKQLLIDRSKPLKLTIPEIIEFIEVYKNKVKNIALKINNL